VFIFIYGTLSLISHLALSYVDSATGLKEDSSKESEFTQDESSMYKAERCKNPWNGKCNSTDIQLYIEYKGRQLPICSRCWNKIADRRIEWGREVVKPAARGD
jgi:hypothetical protein